MKADNIPSRKKTRHEGFKTCCGIKKNCFKTALTI